MNSLWKKTGDAYESTAKVVDGNLILSLPDAINPIVWRMELGSVKASALEVKAHSTDGTYLLSLKTPKGEVHDIAPFHTRDLAVRALMRVSSALQGAHGKIAPVTLVTASAAAQPVKTDKSDASAMKWLLALGGVLAVIFLFAYSSSLTPKSKTSANVEASGDMATSKEPSGVPQSADELLRGMQ